MNMKTILSCILLIFTLSSSSQTQKLTIYFNNLSSNKGKIMLLIQDENENDVSKLVVNIDNKSSKITIYLPKGKYGVVAFHDLNNNEKLDTNFIGIPTEPYGFSNDARAMLSKPDFEETLVNLISELNITFELK